MQERLKSLCINPFFIIGITGMFVLLIFNASTSIYYYLAVAQLLYVPLIVEQVTVLARWQKCAIIAGQIAVVANFFIEQPVILFIASLFYAASMMAIFSSGVQRFLKRGFIHSEEIIIDVGLFYSVMAAAWYFAYVNEINTGFSPLITWLTAIHFHYSAMILCITVGLVGRIAKFKLYKFCAAIIGAGPMLVAIGITFSRVIEILSVSLYVAAIFIFTYFLFTFNNKMIHFVRLAFLTLCFTIVWSFLYAYSNFTQSDLVSIPDMLKFHGILNCIIFGSAITVAWYFYVPATKFAGFDFPRSGVVGQVQNSNIPHNALVDNMDVFFTKETIPNMLYDFYENTSNYELNASVKWSKRFLPFAIVYKVLSKWLQQLNLPLSKSPTTMNGEIFKLHIKEDGRSNPRVWQRKIKNDTVFTAIYATHEKDEHTYMNIALPLPKSTMHGILTVTARNNQLYLTSDDIGDAGTYLTIANKTMKLPLHEYFLLKSESNTLLATHTMKIFGLKFLTIDYTISKME